MCYDVFTDNTQFTHTQIFLCAQVRFDNEFVELSLTLSFIEYALNFISLVWIVLNF